MRRAEIPRSVLVVVVEIPRLTSDNREAAARTQTCASGYGRGQLRPEFLVACAVTPGCRIGFRQQESRLMGGSGDTYGMDGRPGGAV